MELTRSRGSAFAEASAVVTGKPPKALTQVRFAVPIKLLRNKPADVKIKAEAAGDRIASARESRSVGAWPKIIEGKVSKVHWEHTHERINVQEYIEGIPGTRTPQLLRDRLDLVRTADQAGFTGYYLAELLDDRLIGVVVAVRSREGDDGGFHLGDSLGGMRA